MCGAMRPTVTKLLRMNERGNDRALLVMRLAESKARRMGYDYIGTEHILLGLIEEREGVAARVLDEFRVDELFVRNESTKFVPEPARKRSRLFRPRRLVRLPRARQAMRFAIDEAEKLKHPLVGTGHLLLGLTRECEGVAFTVLSSRGLDVEQIRAKVLRLLADDDGSSTDSVISPPKSKRRWFQFRLRTLFFVVTAFGVWLGWEAHVVRQAEADAIAVVLADVQRRGGDPHREECSAKRSDGRWYVTAWHIWNPDNTGSSRFVPGGFTMYIVSDDGKILEALPGR
jgi:Clp amino terminal domain, pathogenicity island component